MEFFASHVKRGHKVPLNQSFGRQRLGRPRAPRLGARCSRPRAGVSERAPVPAPSGPAIPPGRPPLQIYLRFSDFPLPAVGQTASPLASALGIARTSAKFPSEPESRPPPSCAGRTSQVGSWAGRGVAPGPAQPGLLGARAASALGGRQGGGEHTEHCRRRVRRTAAGVGAGVPGGGTGRAAGARLQVRRAAWRARRGSLPGTRGAVELSRPAAPRPSPRRRVPSPEGNAEPGCLGAVPWRLPGGCSF